MCAFHFRIASTLDLGDLPRAWDDARRIEREPGRNRPNDPGVTPDA